MGKEKLTVFALKDGYGKYDIRDDFDKLKQFSNELGYAFILTFSSEMEELANRLKDIKYVLDTLENWKNESFFELNKTSYELRWSHSNQTIKPIKVTLPQAKKLYKETKMKYDTLLNIIKETYRVHGEKSDGTALDPNEILTDIEF